jgi:hypothetical protein
METITYTRTAGAELTPEELSMLEYAEKFEPVYDEDSPKLTRKQLLEFRPVNFTSMEKRAFSMRKNSFA